PVDQPGDNPGIDIFTERLADLRFDPQLADHAVEGLRQPANLVARGNRYHGVERATLDRGGPGQQTTHRTHQAERDGGGEDDAEQRGNSQQRQADLDNVPLVGAGSDDGGTG